MMCKPESESTTSLSSPTFNAYVAWRNMGDTNSPGLNESEKEEEENELTESNTKERTSSNAFCIAPRPNSPRSPPACAEPQSLSLEARAANVVAKLAGPAATICSRKPSCVCVEPIKDDF